MTDSKREKVLQDLTKSINNKLKRSALQYGQTPTEIFGFLSFGNTLIDLQLGPGKNGAKILGLPDPRGGAPLGRIMEIFGPESSGKSSLAEQLIACTQKRKGVVYVFDAEAGMTKPSVERLGAHVDDVIWVKGPDDTPIVAEQALEVIESAIKSHSDMLKRPDLQEVFGDEVPPLLMIWDTIAASPTWAQLNENAGMADAARVFSVGFAKIKNLLGQTPAALVILNQTRWGGPNSWEENTPGGNALKFYADVRLRIRNKGKLWDEEGEAGNYLTLFTRKLKYGRARKTINVPFYFDRGTDEFLSLWEWLYDEHRRGPASEGRSGVYNAGSWMKVDLPSGTRSFQGMNRFADNLDDELKEFLLSRTLELWN